MIEDSIAPALEQLEALARNVGVSHEQLLDILREVNAKADAEGREVSMAERLIAARSRVMQAALG